MVAELSMPPAPAVSVIELALMVCVRAIPFVPLLAPMFAPLPLFATPPLAPPVTVIAAALMSWSALVTKMPARLPAPTVPPVTTMLPALMDCAPPFCEPMNAPLLLPLAPPVTEMLPALTACCPLPLWNTPELKPAVCDAALPPVTVSAPVVDTLCVDPDPDCDTKPASALLTPVPTIVIDPDSPVLPAVII